MSRSPSPGCRPHRADGRADGGGGCRPCRPGDWTDRPWTARLWTAQLCRRRRSWRPAGSWWPGPWPPGDRCGWPAPIRQACLQKLSPPGPRLRCSRRPQPSRGPASFWRRGLRLRRRAGGRRSPLPGRTCACGRSRGCPAARQEPSAERVSGRRVRRCCSGAPLRQSEPQRLQWWYLSRRFPSPSSGRSTQFATNDFHGSLSRQSVVREFPFTAQWAVHNRCTDQKNQPIAGKRDMRESYAATNWSPRYFYCNTCGRYRQFPGDERVPHRVRRSAIVDVGDHCLGVR